VYRLHIARRQQEWLRWKYECDSYLSDVLAGAVRVGMAVEYLVDAWGPQHVEHFGDKEKHRKHNKSGDRDRIVLPVVVHDSLPCLGTIIGLLFFFGFHVRWVAAQLQKRACCRRRCISRAETRLASRTYVCENIFIYLSSGFTPKSKYLEYK
jgi:hypothetical protein